jgi:tetratricopeptide (TPR) repeat protein
MSQIQTDIEAHLAKVEPDVEVLLAEVVGGGLVRLFIDHPQGVSLDLCARDSNHLPMVRETYALEVSSPGTERPLSKAAGLEPDKTSIREALGRALFRSHRFREAAAEFEAIVEHAPTNDYALFCLGRALLELGRPKEARKPLALAAQLRPERRDYRIYRERAAKAA